MPEGLERGEALRHSLISTHPVLRVEGGRFISQLDAPCESVNTWPVLASPEDDVMLGAAIILPDHPQIAPESRGNLFDNTEIEEALVLHVQALSDEERAEIERAGPGGEGDDRTRLGGRPPRSCSSCTAAWSCAIR